MSRIYSIDNFGCLTIYSYSKFKGGAHAAYLTQGRRSGPKSGGWAHLASAKGHIVGVRGHAPQILN